MVAWLETIPAQWRVMAGVLCISFSPIFVALADVAPTTSAFYRVAIGGAALVLVLLAIRQRPRFSTAVYAGLVLTGVWFTADLWFWHRSIRDVGPGLSTLLASLQVCFVTLIGWLVFRERVLFRQWIAIPMALFGLSLVVGVDWNALPADYRRGVIYGVLTGLSYALYLMTLRRVQAETRSTLPMAEIAAMSLASAAILAGIAGAESQSLAITSPTAAAWLFAYGVLAHVLGWLLIASGIAMVTPAVFGLSLLSQPLLTFIWDILIFGRGITLVEFVGGVITLIAIFIGSTARAGRKPREASSQRRTS
ncbi:MAG: DMT family transporter [Pseudomonadota bacterium]